MLQKLVAHALGLLNAFPLVIFSKKKYFFQVMGHLPLFTVAKVWGAGRVKVA